MSERRAFSDRERAALYIAAGGLCSACGAKLGPGWHADHVHPHSRGGSTDVVNGQALCPMIRRLVADDKEALDLLDQALQNPPGTHTGVDNIHARPNGTSEAAALRRLRKDKPELHADVLAGRLTAHGAMVKAGFRPRTLTVPLGRPDSVAQTLIKHMEPSELVALVRLLADALADALGEA